MSMEERLEATRKAAANLMTEAYAVDGVIAVQVGIHRSYVPTEPTTPEVRIYSEQPDKAEAATAAGDLPTELKTAFETVPVRIVPATMKMDAGERERPMQPGASIGSPNPGGRGTFGALVNQGTSGITAGHAVGPANARVYQPGPGDRPMGPDTLIGKVTANSYAGGVDAALFSITDSATNATDTPHYHPTPSPQNPALGLYIGRVNANKPNEQLIFVDMATALAAVGGALPADYVSIALDEERVVGSGASSGLIDAKVASVGTVKQFNGVVVAGFYADRITGGEGGDSGAVVVRRPTAGYLWDETNGGQTVALGYDDDTTEEWLPGTPLDALMGGPGSGEVQQDLGMDDNAFSMLVDSVKNTVKRLFGNLSIEVIAETAPNPCSPTAPATGGATSCEVRISRADGEIEIRPPREPAPAAVAVQPGDGRCCTFGRQPSVSVSGDDSEEATFEIDVRAARLRVHILAKQKVSDASFRRTGLCWAGRCDKERIGGYVLAQRTTLVEMEAAAGSIKIPGLGRIEAGSGMVKKESKTTVRKEFILKCSSAG